MNIGYVGSIQPRTTLFQRIFVLLHIVACPACTPVHRARMRLLCRRHSGTRSSTSSDTWHLYFDGQLNVKRILADLIEKQGLGDAKHVLLTGGSAGGRGWHCSLTGPLGEKGDAGGSAVLR